MPSRTLAEATRQTGQRNKQALTLKNAVESTQRRKGAKTQGFRFPGTFTRWVSKFEPVFPSQSPCPHCVFASLRFCVDCHFCFYRRKKRYHSPFQQNPGISPRIRGRWMPTQSGARQQGTIGLFSRKLQAGPNVFRFQKRVVFENQIGR